jgi:hypothetical protein
MSLVRLLTSGKSLIGLQNVTSRYRMSGKDLLPKFGSDKNPFSSSQTETVAVELPSANGSAMDSGVSSRVPRYQMTPAELAAARLKETKKLPVSAVPLVQVENKAGFIEKTITSFSERIAKTNLFAWWQRRKTRVRPVNPIPASKAPIQAELSLDNIKVMRNDLSDADVEVVPSKPAAKPKPQPTEPVRAEQETAELIKT